MVLLIFPLVFYVTHSSLRYRFPIDPIMLVLAVERGGAFDVARASASSARRQANAALLRCFRTD